MIYTDDETRSEVDVGVVGAYKYARDPSTEILCKRYAIDDGPVRLWVPGVSPSDSQIPNDLWAALKKDGSQLIEAHNANFEYNIWHAILVEQYDWPPLTSYTHWRCSAVLAAMYSLPRKLEKVAQVLELPEQKDMAGHRVMLQLTKPRTPSKNNPDRFFSDEKRFKRLYSYCGQDVKTERALSQKLRPINKREWYRWYMDQEINTRGVFIDVPAIEAAAEITRNLELVAQKRLNKLTNGAVEGPTKVPAIKAWAKKQGVTIKSLAKENLAGLLADKKIPKKVREVVKLRDQNNKSSTAKLNRLLTCVCDDGRVRDSLLFYGAHTGRWTGSGFQPQNLPKGSLKHDKVVKAIKAIKKGDLEGLSRLGDPLDVISSCIRGFICAPKGRELICADYSSIEARIVLWLAGETEAVEQLRAGRDIYVELAADIYRKAAADIDDDERGNGKRGILGCGYGMGWRKLQATAAQYGAELADELAQKIVETYRKKYAGVPRLWRALGKAAIGAVLHKRTTRVKGIVHDIRFKVKDDFLLCRLPSGRILTYYKPKLSHGKFDRLQITYLGVNSVTKQFTKTYMWGGIFCENVVQALARDVMAFGMTQIEQSKKYDVILTVHDEILAECDKGSGDKKEFIRLATMLEPWSKTCPIHIGKGDCWIGKRYRKG